ncbi:MAG TPA: acyclic terpene utilization AtuA family protein [Thermodesulfobacteriota bacterium]
MKEIVALAPTGMLGSGYLPESFRLAMERKPHFIGQDSGTMDSGPNKLGTGTPLFSRAAYKRDIEIMLRGARRAGIPLLIGSCGGSGSDIGLAFVRDIVEEVAREHRLHFKMALIHAEQQKGYLTEKFRAGRIKPLWPERPFTQAMIDRAEHIVGMMGAEPFMAALDRGAEVVLAGRSSDTSMFAAYFLREGIDPGIAWHTAKILECGAAAVVQRRNPDCMLGFVREDHFIIEPSNPELRCSPQSVASHTLYENGDPFHLVEPAGTLDTEFTTYEAVNDRAVKVSGSRFVPAKPYTVKLEASEKVGYQSVLIGGVRDPFILRQLDTWLSTLKERVAERIHNVYAGEVRPEDYTFNVIVYGRDGVMGPLEPNRTVGHEVGLVFEVTAQTQQRATDICKSVSHLAAHHPVKEWSGLITGVAFPYALAPLERGLVCRFTMNHVVEVDDPLEMFPIEYVQV